MSDTLLKLLVQFIIPELIQDAPEIARDITNLLKNKGHVSETEYGDLMDLINERID